MNITITDRAAAHMKKQLRKRLTCNRAIRVGLRGGGCSGYSYQMQFEDCDPRETDHVIEAAEVVVYIDAKSAVLMEGLTIDFETGIRGHGFKFINPNVKGSCGCGESVLF